MREILPKKSNLRPRQSEMLAEHCSNVMFANDVLL